MIGSSTRRIVAAMALGTALSMAVAPARADEQEDARAHFSAGVSLLQDPARPRYDEAYAEFKKAYALAASPKILGNIGLCAMKLERDAEAIQAYSQYLNNVPDLTAEERAQVERDLTTLKTTLAKVSVTTVPPGASIHDTRVGGQGASVTNVYGPISAPTELQVRRGYHVFKARLDDGRETTWEGEISGGESHVFELHAPEAPVAPVVGPLAAEPAPTEPTRPISTPVYIAGGLTLAAGIGSLVTGLVALDSHSKFDGKNNGEDPAAADDLRRTGTTLNVVSDVLLITAIVGAGVTTYLFLTRPSAPVRTGLSTMTLRF